MKKLLKETLVTKNALFFAMGGVSAAVIATSDVKTAVLCAVTVLVAVVLASTAAAFTSLLCGRLGVCAVYVAVSSGVMAAGASAASNLIPATADTLATALLVAAVSGIVLSCAPKKDEQIAHSVVRASVTALMYAIMMALLGLVRFALSRVVPFAASPAMTLILIGFTVAAVNFMFVSIAEREERRFSKEVTDDDR